LTAFLRSLRARGLTGVRLVISDAHEGLRGAISAVMIGAGWQRCRVHFMRNVLARVPKGSAEMVAAAIRTIFAQPDAEAVHEQLASIADKLGRQFPAVQQMLTEAAPDICALRGLPPEPLAPDLEHQPPRAGQRRDQAPRRRGGDLPQRAGDRAPGGRRADGDP
jgi:putative transposase